MANHNDHDDDYQDMERAHRNTGNNGRRLTDNNKYNAAKLALTALLVLTPVVSGTLVLYGNIRVLSAQVKSDIERIENLEKYIHGQDWVANSEMQNAMIRLEAKMNQHHDRLMGLEIRFNSGASPYVRPAAKK